MIPDFNTYLKESIWSNINKRSEGNIERKEDDINDLDRDGLFNHIFSLYEKTTNQFGLDPYVPDKRYSDSFAIYLFKDDSPHRLWVKFEDGKINRMYLQALPTECREFYKELDENYSLDIVKCFIYIYEKNNTVSNRTCMDVIKLIIENSSRPLLKVKI